jgi:hypothetical protein
MGCIGTRESLNFLPIFSTGAGVLSVKNSPVLGVVHSDRSQVGVCSGFPLIHRPYYNYYNN